MKPTDISFPRCVNFVYDGRTYNVYELGDEYTTAYIEIFTEIEGYISFEYARTSKYNEIQAIGLSLLESSFKNEFLALCEKYPEVDVNIDDYGNKIRIIGAWDDSTECEEE